MLPVVLLATVAICLLALPRAGRINKANFDRILVGMSPSEVEELLRVSEVYRTRFPVEELRATYCDEQRTAFPPEGQIRVVFVNDRVVEKDYSKPTVKDFWDRLVIRAKLVVGR